MGKEVEAVPRELTTHTPTSVEASDRGGHIPPAVSFSSLEAA